MRNQSNLLHILPIAAIGLLSGCLLPENPASPQDEQPTLAVAATIGVPTVIPGRIQTEDYKGTSLVGYYDRTPGNQGGVYRGDDVDICQADGGGYTICYAESGEWLAFDIQVPVAGRYNLIARLASGVTGTKTIAVSLDGANVGSFTYTDASGWNSYRNATLNNINFPAGNHVIRLTFTNGNVNMNYLDVINPGQLFSAAYPGMFLTAFKKGSGSPWGAGYGSTFGKGNNSGEFLTPTSINAGFTLNKAAGGMSYAQYLSTAGILYAVGDNSAGQLGDGTLVGRFSPVEVQRDVKDVIAGGNWTLALKTNGSVVSTGKNEFGQLGSGNLADRRSFGTVRGGIASFAVGGAHSLLVGTDGVLYGMGSDLNGQMGFPVRGNRYTTPIRIFDRVRKAAGTGMGTVALRTDGTVWVTGMSRNGELGAGNPDVKAFTQTLSGIKDIGCGINHCLFLRNNGELLGSGLGLALGVGDDFDYPTPWRITNDVATISVGIWSSFYTDHSGVIWATGGNRYGQLGVGTKGQNTGDDLLRWLPVRYW